MIRDIMHNVSDSSYIFKGLPVYGVTLRVSGVSYSLIRYDQGSYKILLDGSHKQSSAEGVKGRS